LPNWNGSPGYCAFRLGRFETALGHFEAFRDTVFSPISWAAPGYWLGRTHEALGNEAEAAEAYALGAQYQSSFYGQLARNAAALPPTRPSLPMRISAIGAGGVHDIVGLPRRASSIRSRGTEPRGTLPHPSDRKPVAQEAGHAGRFRAGTGDAHVALRIAKRAAQNGYEIMRAYYPITDLADGDWPIDGALALSIARRESEFDPGVISHAGAMGLMQVMPGTGRDTAAELEIEYDARPRSGRPGLQRATGDVLHRGAE
jgi:soluble lytic murein transglycosylase